MWALALSPSLVRGRGQVEFARALLLGRLMPLFLPTLHQDLARVLLGARIMRLSIETPLFSRPRFVGDCVTYNHATEYFGRCAVSLQEFPLDVPSAESEALMKVFWIIHHAPQPLSRLSG